MASELGRNRFETARDETGTACEWGMTVTCMYLL